MKRRTNASEDQDFGAAFQEDVIDYISKNFTPEDVFSREVLVEWATDNDFINANDLETKGEDQ